MEVTVDTLESNFLISPGPYAAFLKGGLHRGCVSDYGCSYAVGISPLVGVVHPVCIIWKAIN